jgi:type II secretory pathway pseudopilin PulG
LRKISRLHVVAFTLLEVVAVLMVIGILAVMLIPAYSTVRMRAQRVSCVSNLKNLYVAANAHTQDRQSWPQIPTTNLQSPGYANGWIEALRPYGIGPKNWVCPTVQDLLRGNAPASRIDYLAMPFAATATAPYRYPTHPWFVERADVHGDGQMLILASGEIYSSREVARDARFRYVSPF